MSHEPVKAVTDGISLLTVVATLADWLPAVAALVSIVWYCHRIYEWYERRRNLVKEAAKEFVKAVDDDD